MLSINYPELKPFITGGVSWSKVFETLYYAHLLRYSTAGLLQDTTGCKKLATWPKLSELADLGYLKKDNKVFKSTNKTFELLVKQAYNPALLPEPAKGNGAEFYNQVEIAKLLQHPLCWKRDITEHLQERCFLYPNFGYVMPDGLFVMLDKAKDVYQLNFIEIESKKPDLFWQQHLEGKRQNYERLARDPIVYKYWQIMSQHLGLKCPAIGEFRFGVWCVGDIRREWHGWVFSKSV